MIHFYITRMWLMIILLICTRPAPAQRRGVEARRGGGVAAAEGGPGTADQDPGGEE
jgi:hypothetical protein